MSGNYDYIPSGQTSMIKKGNVAVQIQTEYSFRPHPRIKTTIFNDGRVVHKVEKKLDRAVDSIDAQQRVEGIIRNQHKEIVAVVKESSSAVAPALKKDIPAQSETLTLREKLGAIPGITAVYELDSSGNFNNRKGSDRFRKIYAAICKSLPELMSIFSELSGPRGKREKGVYEVERDCLYFASGGDYFYFITVRRANETINYEKAIKETVCPFGEF